MDLSLLLAERLLPLYGYVLLGFLAGRWLKVNRQDIARMVLFLIVPLMFFTSISVAPFDMRYLLLPVVTFCMAGLITAAAFQLVRPFYTDAHRYLIASTAGTGNTGYFGVPVFLAVAGAETLGVYILAMMGITVFESVVGYYLISRGRHTVSESLKKLLRLPTLYAVAAGLVVNAIGIEAGATITASLEQIRGAYVILGMMIVGLGLSTLQRFTVDIKFTACVFFQRFALWPLLGLAVLYADRHWLHFFDAISHQVVWVLAIVPLAANTVAFATEVNLHPEKVATAVLLSTLLALLFIPLVLPLGV